MATSTTMDQIIQQILEEPFEISEQSKKATNDVTLIEVNEQMVDEACASLAKTCISITARPFFQTVLRQEVLGVVGFLNKCLVPPTKFVNATRERAWTLFHSLYKDKMPAVLQLTGTAHAAAWLCMKIFQILLDKNYPLCSEGDRQVRLGRIQKLDDSSKSIVKYIGGCIVNKLMKKTKQKESHKYLEVFREEVEKRRQTDGLTDILDRGGLTYLTKTAEDFFFILEDKTSEVLQLRTDKTCTLADFDEICESDETLTSTYYALTYNVETDEGVRNSLFSKIVQLYFKIRVHHECRMFKERVKAKQRHEIKQKGLRKSLG